MAFDKYIRKANNLMDAAEHKVDFAQASQTLLMSTIESIAASGRTLNEEGWSTFTCLEDPDPALTVSKVLSFGQQVVPYVENGGDAGIASKLTPRVNLYKVIRDENEKVVRELEIPLFANRLEPRVLGPGRVLSEHGFDGLTLELSDQTAFGASRLVKVGLNLSFTDVSGLTELILTEAVDPNTMEGTNEYFQYIDLIRRTNGRISPSTTSYAPDHYSSYSLRLELGMSDLSDAARNSLVGDKYSREEIDEIVNAAVETNNLVMVLELEDFDLNFSEDGRVSLNLSYYSWIERQSELVDYDIFNNVKTTSTAEIKAQMDKAYAAAGKAELINERTRIKAEIADLESELARVGRLINYFDGQDDVISQAEIEDLGLNQELVQEANSGNPEAKRIIKSNKLRIYRKLHAKQRGLANDLGGIFYNTVTEQNSFGPGGKLEELEDINKKLDALDKQVQVTRERLLFSNKVEKYSRLLNHLVDNGKIYHLMVPQKRLYIYSPEYMKFLAQAFAEDNVTGLGGEQEITPEEIQFILAQQRSADAGMKGTSSTTSSLSLKDQIKEEWKYLQQKEKEDPSSQKLGKQAISNGLKRFLGPRNGEASKDGNYQVHYVYFGDLIDAALSIGDKTAEKMRQDKAGVVIGNFSYINMFNPHNNLQSLPDSDYSATSINFADVPISLELFSEFFAATVTNKNLTKMPFLQLLRGLVNELLIPSFNKSIAGIPNQHPIMAKTINLPSIRPLDQSGFNKAFRQKLLNLGFSDNLTPNASSRVSMNNPSVKEAVREAVNITSSTRGKSGAKNLWNYFFLHGAQNKVLTGLGRSKDEDIANGIYHFSFGGGSLNQENPKRGRTDITESIQFTKVKQTGQREMMVDRYMNADGSDQNIELWSVFDVEVTMIGNNLLTPGKFIYIQPRAGLLAGNSPIAAELGLGGYYLVTNVSHEILGEAFYWRTKIKAAWQSGPISDPHSTILQSASERMSYAQQEALNASVGYYFTSDPLQENPDLAVQSRLTPEDILSER